MSGTQSAADIMFETDPRDHDFRQDERFEIEHGRGSRGASNGHDRDDDWRQPEVRVRDADDHAHDLGRGPGSNNRNDDSAHGRRDCDDARWPERDHDSRGLDPRDVFMRDLDMPRGPAREIVHDARERVCTLRGSETRTLSTVGAFRVVSARDLQDHHGGPADPRSGDLPPARARAGPHRAIGRSSGPCGGADRPQTDDDLADVLGCYVHYAVNHLRDLTTEIDNRYLEDSSPS